MTNISQPSLSVVAPVFNEEGNLEEFYRRLKEALHPCAPDAEIIFVNDGSVDRSLSIIQSFRKKDPSVRILDFSRNFGHQIAVKAGIDHSRGKMVVILDSDLQDPPEVISEMMTKSREGYDVVYAVRAARDGEGFMKKLSAKLYYRLIRRLAGLEMPLDAGDFRLLTRRVADVLRNIHDKNPYIRGLTSWVGFKQTGIPVHREARFSGKTKYSYGKMLALAWDGITHFSFFPLQLAGWLGLAVSVLCVILIVQALYVRLILKTAVSGWTSLMVAVLFLGSVQLIILGIIGSYLAKNYDQTRARPLYLLKGDEHDA